MKVLTLGTFDLLHYGHVDFLRQCARLGELTVGVNSDRFAESFKRRPVMSEAERMHAVSGLGYHAILNDGPGRDLIEATRPGVLAVGSDWAGRDYHAQVGVDQEWLNERVIIVAYVPRWYWQPISTTEIIRRVRDR